MQASAIAHGQVVDERGVTTDRIGPPTAVSKPGAKSTPTMSRAKNAPRSSAPWSQPCECPPRRRSGAGELNTATDVPSIEAAERRPPKVRYSFDSDSRSTSRIGPQEKSVSIGSWLVKVSLARAPRPSAVIHYSMASGS